MSCLCGDTHCWSCGPAQGNWRCPICRAWADDGCEHVTEDGDGLRPEFTAEADRLAREEAEADNELCKWLAEADRLALEDELAEIENTRARLASFSPRSLRQAATDREEDEILAQRAAEIRAALNLATKGPLS